MDAGQQQMQPIKSALTAHLTWMTAHPAAVCFRDAYAADRAVADAYLAWMANWKPWGGELTGEGRAQDLALQAADAKRNAFLSAVSSYFTDCR